MCVFPNAKQLGGWEQGVDGITAIDFLEECCSCTNHMQNLCKKVKTYLRNISRENGKGISINLGT